MSYFLTRYYRFILVAILAFSFFTRIYNLHQPEGYVFDEVYHGITAKLIARNDPRAYEWWNQPVEPNTAVDWLHPPYAKYTQALSILVFGENSFGWRFSSAVFGVFVIAAVYKLSEVSFKNKPLALTAAFLASLDGLLLVQSRVAMNDIHVTFLILLTLIFYQLYRQKNRALIWLLATGLSAGLAVGTKWSGVFIVGLIGLWETVDIGMGLWHEIGTSKVHLVQLFKRVFLTFFCLVVIPAGLYLGSYSHMFIQGKDLQHLYGLHQQIWWYQTNLTATHGYQSRPWQWFLNLRPVWYHVTYSTPGQIANIYAFGNPALSWLGVIAVVSTILYFVWTAGKKNAQARSLFLILTSYLIVWVPWQFSPRIMFYYHYTPAIPLLAILLAYWLRILWKNKYQWAVYVAVSVIGLAFILWYPHWTGISVPVTYADRLYYAISSWK